MSPARLSRLPHEAGWDGRKRRQSQSRLILQPIAAQLLARLGQAGLEERLRGLLATLRAESPAPGYAGGNILNLLLHLKSDLSRFDFSSITVWQAYLQGMDLQDVNFSGADLVGSVFTDTFGPILSVAFSPDEALIAAGTLTINPQQDAISQELQDKHYLRKHGKNANYGQK